MQFRNLHVDIDTAEPQTQVASDFLNSIFPLNFETMQLLNSLSGRRLERLTYENGNKPYAWQLEYARALTEFLFTAGASHRKEVLDLLPKKLKDQVTKINSIDKFDAQIIIRALSQLNLRDVNLQPDKPISRADSELQETLLTRTNLKMVVDSALLAYETNTDRPYRERVTKQVFKNTLINIKLAVESLIREEAARLNPQSNFTSPAVVADVEAKLLDYKSKLLELWGVIAKEEMQRFALGVFKIERYNAASVRINAGVQGSSKDTNETVTKLTMTHMLDNDQIQSPVIADWAGSYINNADSVVTGTGGLFFAPKGIYAELCGEYMNWLVGDISKAGKLVSDNFVTTFVMAMTAIRYAQGNYNITYNLWARSPQQKTDLASFLTSLREQNPNVTLNQELTYFLILPEDEIFYIQAHREQAALGSKLLARVIDNSPAYAEMKKSAPKPAATDADIANSFAQQEEPMKNFIAELEGLEVTLTGIINALGADKEIIMLDGYEEIADIRVAITLRSFIRECKNSTSRSLGRAQKAKESNKTPRKDDIPSTLLRRLSEAYAKTSPGILEPGSEDFDFKFVSTLGRPDEVIERVLSAAAPKHIRDHREFAYLVNPAKKIADMNVFGKLEDAEILIRMKELLAVEA